MIGTAVGHYRVTARLSAGGMGIVYRAEHELLGKPAAVKILHPELTTNRDIVDRFFKEAKTTTSIQHAGIVQVFDFGYLPSGHAYLVMELLDGEPLSAALRRGRLGQPAAIALVRGVCSALTAAHAKGVIHRDLKPDNIFLVPDSDAPLGVRPKLLDFGIAKLTEVGMNDSATKTGAVMGTPTYMSPEQCSGRGQIDPRADLYSLGCVLYELVAGRPPFTGLGAGELIGQHLFVQPESPRVYVPDLSIELEQLIMSLLAKSPAERPGSAAELAQRLDEVARGNAAAMGTGTGAAYGAAYDAAGAGALTPAHLTPLPPAGQPPGAMGSSPGVPGMAMPGMAMPGAAVRSGPEAPTMATPHPQQGGGPTTLGGAVGSVAPGSSRRWLTVVGGGLLLGTGVAAALMIGGVGDADERGAAGTPAGATPKATGQGSDAASAAAVAPDAASAAAVAPDAAPDAAPGAMAADAAITAKTVPPSDAGAVTAEPAKPPAASAPPAAAAAKTRPPKAKPKTRPKNGDMPTLIEDDI